MPRRTHHRSPERQALVIALGLSAVVHLILVVLALLLPADLISAVRADRPALDPVVAFRIAPPVEAPEEAAEPAGRRGEVPIAMPDTPVVPPPADPAPQREPEPVPPETLPELRPAPERSQPPPPPVAERPPERPPESRPRPAAPSPEDGAGPQPPERTPPEAPAGAGAGDGDGDGPETTRDLDVRQALRDFRPAPGRGAPRDTGPDGSGSDRHVFVPDLSRLPTTGFGMGNLTFESRDYDWNDYGRQIYMAIWRAWHSRLWATTADFEKWAHESRWWSLDHQVAVRFVIERNGGVTGIRIERPSAGCWPLDNSATAALDEVILPPLPADFPRDREVVHARFIARGDVRGLRPTLREFKRLGLF